MVNFEKLREMIEFQAERDGETADSKMTNEGVLDLIDTVVKLQRRYESLYGTMAALRQKVARAVGDPDIYLLVLEGRDDGESHFIHTKGVPLANNKSRFCCPQLDEMMGLFDLPIGTPFVGLSPTGEIEKSDVVAIKMMNYTPAGAISRRGRVDVVINFCPFCGTRITPDEVT